MLSVYDYKILDFICSFDGVSRTDIEKNLGRKVSGIPSRITSLLSRGFIADRYSETDDDYERPPKPLNIYHITSDGKRALQDYKSVSVYNKLKTVAAILTLVASIVAAVAAVISALK